MAPRSPPLPPAWAAELTTVGVTGTNGKTTTTSLVAAAMRCLGGPVARVTTLGPFLDDEPLDLPLDYAGFLATMGRCRDRGGKHAAIELTSEALARGWGPAWPCKVGVFTNITRDHFDAHSSPEHYLASKAQLFVHLPEDGVAVLNGCDPASSLLEEIVPAGVRILRYGVATRGRAIGSLDFGGRKPLLSWSGTRLVLDEGAHAGLELSVRAIGEVFAENALAAFAAALAVGVPPNAAADAIARMEPPRGRFEVVGARPHVVVDYAHTPDALARTLRSARALCEAKLTVVFGAGGERDRGKRSLMGAAASAADRVVLTSDNPRGEDPARICDEIRAGIGGVAVVDVILDRAEAIRAAVRDASERDVVVVAGKGHETEQRIGSTRRPFSDREVALEALRASR